MHGPELGAAMECGHGLAPVQQAVRIERALDREEAGELTSAELQAHLIDLLYPDAVLAGDRAARADAELKDAGAEGFGALRLIALVGVEHDERMQVAVAGV